MSNSVLDIAYNIIHYCNHHNIKIEELRLQKLLYLVWIEYYKQTGKALFSDSFEARDSGPTILNIHIKFAGYSCNTIPLTYGHLVSAKVMRAITSTVWDYAEMPLGDLTDIVQRKGSPWDKVFDGGKGKNERIPYSLIIELECNNSLKRNTRWLFTFETGEDWRPGSYGCNEECPFRTAVRFENDECIYTAETCPLKNHIKEQSSLDAESKDE